MSSEEISDDDSHSFIPMKKPRLPSSDWLQKYEPKVSSDLCIHPKKLAEVKLALTDMIHGDGPKLLVLTGPSGSGKSTTTKILAQELAGSFIEYLDSNIQLVPLPQHFGEFLHGAKYRTGANLTVVLIEELPNVFHAVTLANFRQSLAEWMYTDSKTPPLVLCLSEIEIDTTKNAYFNVENNLTIDTLLGRQLLESAKKDGRLKHIKFNAVAKTYINKVTKKIMANESIFSRLSKRDLGAFLLTLTETGDIRSVVCNLELYAKLESKANSTVSDMFIRENQLNLFHAIGKVVFSSSKFHDLDEEVSDYLSVEAVLQNYHNSQLLSLSLLENYQIYNNLNYDVEIAAKIADNLSMADTLGSEAGRHVSIRGTRSELRNIKKTSTLKPQMIKFPRQFKMLKEYNRTKKEIGEYRRWCNKLSTSFENLNLLDGYFLPIIYNSFKYRYVHGKTPYSYNRLGGKFKEIFADDQIPVFEQEESKQTRDQFHLEIVQSMENDDYGSEDLSDPIEESEESDDDFNDSLDGAIDDLFKTRSVNTQ